MIDKLILTGVNGCLGRLITEIADSRGLPVRALARQIQTNKWSLDSLQEELLLDQSEKYALLHLAIPPQPRMSSKYQSYESNTIELVKSALSKKIRFVFASSLSVHPGNPSIYAQQKARLETMIVELGGEVARFGLISCNEKASSYKQIKLLQRIIPRFILSSSASKYFVTDDLALQNWFDTALIERRNTLELVANRSIRSLKEIFEEVPTLTKQNFEPKHKRFGDKFSNRMTALLINPLTDPFLNLRFGMEIDESCNELKIT